MKPVQISGRLDREIGAALQSYIPKKTDRKEMFTAIESAWDRLSKP
ncbi:hypothetical protein GE107_12560 [Cohnella sp. CFH 77786]|nr:hypothetical protein [Cohnella sp. CFH 77786]MBW5446892.1 hypothetical protein [Cohnella sp. CFH 77786]